MNKYNIEIYKPVNIQVKTKHNIQKGQTIARIELVQKHRFVSRTCSIFIRKLGMVVAYHTHNVIILQNYHLSSPFTIVSLFHFLNCNNNLLSTKLTGANFQNKDVLLNKKGNLIFSFPLAPTISVWSKQATASQEEQIYQI